MLVESEYFYLRENQRFSLFFFALKLEMHARCDNQYKTGSDRGNILGQPILFECMSTCVLSLLIPLILFKFSQIYKIGRPYRGIFILFLEAFLEGSVDHIIYRDYIENRRSFIYCSLACTFGTQNRCTLSLCARHDRNTVEVDCAIHRSSIHHKVLDR